MLAGMVVTVTCERCQHTRSMYAYKLVNLKTEARTLPLREPVPGFYCRRCRRKVHAIISAPLHYV